MAWNFTLKSYRWERIHRHNSSSIYLLIIAGSHSPSVSSSLQHYDITQYYPLFCVLLVYDMGRQQKGCAIVLLRWQEFATRSVAVFFWHATTVPVLVANIVQVSRLGLLIRNRWMSRLLASRSFRLSWNALLAK